MRTPPSELVHVGQLVDLDVTGVAHPGRFVGRVSGLAVFVAGTDIGERVRVRITTVKRRYAEGELVEVLTASPNRVPNIWPEADISRPPEDRVGGADYGHLTLAHQRELKAQVLHEAFARVGGFKEKAPSPAVEAVPGRQDGLHWRTRELLQVDADGRLGAFAARSHTIVPVATLPLVAQDLLETLQSAGAAEPGVPEEHSSLSGFRFPARAQIRVARDEEGPNRVIIATGGNLPTGKPVVRTAAGHRFEVAADGFWQVHESAPETLAQAVRRAAPAGRFRSALDLYGGVGLFAAVLADGGARVETIEADHAAAGLAKKNLAESGVRVSPGRVDRVLGRFDQQRARWVAGGVAVLDPPRSGAGKGVLQQLGRLRLGRIIYVACDPVALARDARTLLTIGYQLEHIQAFDLFPHSHHLETVAVFDR